MNSKTNPLIIGSFIIGALLLLICSIFIFSSDSWLRKNHKFIVIFTESINGLNIGAPIKLYGVQIGHVTEISVQRDIQLNKTLIPVVFEVDQQKLANYIDTQKQNWTLTEVDKLIESGLRMQLQLGSLVTGQLFIEALFLPETPIKLYSLEKNYKEIPSIPSNSDEIQQALKTVLEGTKSINVVELLSNLDKTLANIKQITGSTQTKSTLTALNGSMRHLENILSTLNHDIAPLSHNLNKTIQHADKLLITLDNHVKPILEDSHQIVSTGKNTLQAINSTLNEVQSLVDNNSPLNQGLQSALKQITRAARSAKNMMNFLGRHPEALLFGKNLETEEE